MSFLFLKESHVFKSFILAPMIFNVQQNASLCSVRGTAAIRSKKKDEGKNFKMGTL